MNIYQLNTLNTTVRPLAPRNEIKKKKKKEEEEEEETTVMSLIAKSCFFVCTRK